MIEQSNHEDPTEWMREELLHMADAIEDYLSFKEREQIRELNDYMRWLKRYGEWHPDHLDWVARETATVQRQIERLRGRGSIGSRDQGSRPRSGVRAASAGGR
jgi:hypothetical protein